MAKEYDSERKTVLDSYRTKVEVYWKKSVDNRQTLSSEEVSALEMMKKDILERNGKGDELVDKIKRILYFNGVLEESGKEDELRREYLTLSKKYHAGDLSEEEEKKVVTRINDLTFILSEH